MQVKNKHQDSSYHKYDQCHRVTGHREIAEEDFNMNLNLRHVVCKMENLRYRRRIKQSKVQWGGGMGQREGSKMPSGTDL